MSGVTITEALRIAQQAPEGADQFALVLACGFTPLHLKTLTGGHLQRRLFNRAVRVTTGTYGDLPGTLESLALEKAGEGGPDAAALVVEWQNLGSLLYGFDDRARERPQAGHCDR